MLYNQIQESIAFIRTKTDFVPQSGIILGTGLGNLTDEIDIKMSIPYAEIPHFPVSTVQSHKGQLIFGELDAHPVVVLAGRFHYYEGYSMKELTFPVRVLKFLGIKRLVISNVSGSTNENIEAGDIVLVKDHINFMPENPLRGENDERIGIRFPDMKKAYCESLLMMATRAARLNNIKVHFGVYFALQGPNLETPAEYNFINISGADLVGMSTVPEVIVARHMELPVLVISVVSNKCYPIEAIKETTLEGVIALAKEAEPKMTLLVKAVLAKFNTIQI